MKVVILNNDFRVYWKARLSFLHEYFSVRNIEFFAIELFGKGSPYTFDSLSGGQHWWTCLFPDNSAADLSKKAIKDSIYSALDNLQPDIIIGPSIVFFPGALGISWAKRNKKKFVMFDDAKPSQVKRNFVVQTIKNLITAQADALWLPSKTYDHEYRYFLDRRIPFFYGFSCTDNDFFKAESHYDPTSKNLVCVARLVPIKNIDLMLRAWQLVTRQYPLYNLTIIGNGPQETSLKQIAAALGLTSVKFVDAVDNEALPAYYNSSVAFILPSLSETWGLVVNEAMAAGLPVLLSNTINAANDLLQEGVNGFGFAPGNVDQMYGAIVKFINTGARDRELMSRASQKIIETFSFDKMGGQLFTMLNKLNNQPYEAPGVLAKVVINAWHGRYNTAGWDNLDRK
ncbi:glycosyltransferase [Mucilaginibacter glaciei]|uniref:Glycosyltransferase n=1 Tax=Mucilaginibacter glaciei TaxID=2772109 RepID=A0A926NX52_9SPHI|nr:glycosyltransferase [Mucilaginibacter glaciei]MBD1393319.1 glycosyltransferase [Mucilaginibacter glaciei]